MSSSSLSSSYRVFFVERNVCLQVNGRLESRRFLSSSFLSSSWSPARKSPISLVSAILPSSSSFSSLFFVVFLLSGFVGRRFLLFPPFISFFPFQFSILNLSSHEEMIFVVVIFSYPPTFSFSLSPPCFLFLFLCLFLSSWLSPVTDSLSMSPAQSLIPKDIFCFPYFDGKSKGFVCEWLSGYLATSFIYKLCPSYQVNSFFFYSLCFVYFHWSTMCSSLFFK